jgi:antitoxin component of MazEF toxin-antitoxin module
MALIASKIRRTGDTYVVTIPADEMRARGLEEGQLVGFDPVPMESDARPAVRAAVQEAIDAVAQENEAGLHHLAAH